MVDTESDDTQVRKLINQLSDEIEGEVAKLDAENYKGIYFGEGAEESTKNHDEETGAHFKFQDACKILMSLQQERREHSETTRSNSNQK